jgi:hypothetical protein
MLQALRNVSIQVKGVIEEQDPRDANRRIEKDLTGTFVRQVLDSRWLFEMFDGGRRIVKRDLYGLITAQDNDARSDKEKAWKDKAFDLRLELASRENGTVDNVDIEIIDLD